MRRQPISGSDDNPKKLILAAAACAEDDQAPVPPELTLAWQVERWGAEAVYSGPIPVRLLRRMNASSNIYSAFMSYQAGMHRLADWARANPSPSRIVNEIRTMRQAQQS
jgi:hypothetical protein